LKKLNKIELSDLKIKSNLSNKAWDKGIKGLTKNGLALVSKTENKLFVEIK
jgi:lysyl-tRNA synthetase class 2